VDPSQSQSHPMPDIAVNESFETNANETLITGRRRGYSESICNISEMEINSVQRTQLLSTSADLTQRYRPYTSRSQTDPGLPLGLPSFDPTFGRQTSLYGHYLYPIDDSLQSRRNSGVQLGGVPRFGGQQNFYTHRSISAPTLTSHPIGPGRPPLIHPSGSGHRKPQTAREKWKLWRQNYITRKSLTMSSK